jgi:hypothetical protein
MARFDFAGARALAFWPGADGRSRWTRSRSCCSSVSDHRLAPHRSLTDRPIVGVIAATGVVAILAWRARVATGDERWFVRWLAAALAWCWIVLGLGVAGLATVTPLPVDHYHAYLDPLVFAVVGLGAAGLTAGGQAATGGGARALGPAIASVMLIGLVAWNVTIWPPAVTRMADGPRLEWPAPGSSPRLGPARSPC